VFVAGIEDNTWSKDAAQPYSLVDDNFCVFTCGRDYLGTVYYL